MDAIEDALQTFKERRAREAGSSRSGDSDADQALVLRFKEQVVDCLRSIVERVNIDNHGASVKEVGATFVEFYFRPEGEAAREIPDSRLARASFYVASDKFNTHLRFLNPSPWSQDRHDFATFPVGELGSELVARRTAELISDALRRFG